MLNFKNRFDIGKSILPNLDNKLPITPTTRAIKKIGNHNIILIKKNVISSSLRDKI